jgi:hypothetical protein
LISHQSNGNITDLTVINPLTFMGYWLVAGFGTIRERKNDESDPT